MNKKEREQTEESFFEEVLTTAKEFFLCMHDEPAPYIIPLNYWYSERKIYFHCAQIGHKLDCIKKNNNVSFSAVCDVEILEEKASTAYKSVCGSGIATIITDASEKEYALEEIAKRYNAHCTFPTPPSLLERTAIIRIDVKEITGKARAKKPA